MKTTLLTAGVIIGLLFMVSVTQAAAAEENATTAEEIEKEADGIPEFDKIRTPDSPAFVVLGISPTEIQRPTTPKGLAVSLGEFLGEDSDLSVPENLALEFAPYWLWAHENLTLEEYHRGGAKSLYRAATISIGTAARDVSVADSMVSVTDVAFGFRTRWLDGRDEPFYDNLVNAQITLAEREGQEIADMSASLAEEVARGELAPDSMAARVEEAKKGIHSKYEREAAELARLAKTLGKEAASRKGLVGDLAVATSARYADAKFAEGRWLATQAWATLGYRGGHTDLVALGRYSWMKPDPDHTTEAFDTGLRVIYSNDAYAGSLEAVYRRITENETAPMEDESLYRLTATADYQVRENTWLSFTFGKDFSEEEAGSLFTLANLKWGLSKTKVTQELPAE